VDRQLRNIALITLFLAALTIVAVVSPEHHRSATNTAILYAAIVAAAGSVLGLVGGPSGSASSGRSLAGPGSLDQRASGPRATTWPRWSARK
jgi:hypothetical protein